MNAEFEGAAELGVADTVEVEGFRISTVPAPEALAELLESCGGEQAGEDAENWRVELFGVVSKRVVDFRACHGADSSYVRRLRLSPLLGVLTLIGCVEQGLALARPLMSVRQPKGQSPPAFRKLDHRTLPTI